MCYSPGFGKRCFCLVTLWEQAVRNELSGDYAVRNRTLYHGSKQGVWYPEIRVTRFHSDFYFGFYCTESREQAIRQATRFEGIGVLNEYKFEMRGTLSVLQIPQMSEEWLDFVTACRSGVSHSYDIVEGPMADDQIFNYVQNYLDGKITRAAFWELARFKRPTHQMSFHSARALACLQFVREVEVTDEV